MKIVNKNDDPTDHYGPMLSSFKLIITYRIAKVKLTQR